MCGIAGFYGVGADESLLASMNICQAHRGPDGHGNFLEGPVGLAHQRLAIIDVEHGQQPMTTPDGRFTLIYNGEVYNYLPLREELQATGYRFVTDSDSEVVLAAFAEWGPAAFDRFNGMWGLAIWDALEQRLTLSRDHFGIKPVYFTDLGPNAEGLPQILFGSEIKTLLHSGMVERRPNDRTIYRYLKFRIHEDSNETFFDGIERLAPGEMLTVDATGVRRERFTRLREELAELADQQRPYDDAAVAEYRERFIESIRLRLQSEVPVGTSLSGGLDSSAVAVVINDLLNHGDKLSLEAVGTRQNTFSAVFPNSINDEESYVDEVLEKCVGHVEAHKIKPTADQFKADLVDFIRTQEEPIISTGPYAQYCVMREATQHVTVLLDGQGADEMMAGYIPYYFVYFRQMAARGEYVKLAWEFARSLDILYRLGRFQLAAKLQRKPGIPSGSFINPQWAQNYPDETFTTNGTHLKHRLIEDLFHNSLPSLLRYEDKNTMRFSLEGRVPFLDKEVVKYLFSLSDDAIIRAGWNKRALRDATRGLLPTSISDRRNKIGFTTPQEEWFKRLKNSLHAIFASESFGTRPYFDQRAVLDAFEGYISGDLAGGSMPFWRLLNVELWLREYIDERPADQVAPEVDETGSTRANATSNARIGQVDPNQEFDFGASHQPDKKDPLAPNEGKELDLAMPGGTIARRYPIQTDKFSAETDLDSAVRDHVAAFFAALQSAAVGDEASASDHRAATHGVPWTLSVSEKIVAITQGRSFFTWDVKPSRIATRLSRYVSRTPAGIGLGDPVTMELAIREAGLPRVLFASAAAAVGKALGRKGWFYHAVGGQVRAIDGPTEYSVYPANVSAKLPPKDPGAVAHRLADVVRSAVPPEYAQAFEGVVVMDANDMGRNTLGKDAPRSTAHYEEQFADNPLGQGRAQTPMAVVFER